MNKKIFLFGIWGILGFFLINQQYVLAVDSIEAKQIFSEAQSTFTAGLNQTGADKRLTMLKAASQFEYIVNMLNIENGYLYFNIGNAYYEAGDLGKAILNYRIAERLIPGFMDLKHNLGQARADLNLPISPKSWYSDIIKGVFFWHYMIDYTTRRTGFMLIFVLFWLVLVLLIFQRHTLIKAGLIFVVLLNFAFGSSYLISLYEMQFVNAGVVTAKATFARRGPGAGYEKLFEQPLPGGTEFDIVDDQADWWKVQLRDSEMVWLKKEDIWKI